MACEDDKTTCEEACKVKKHDYFERDVPYKSYVVLISLAILFGITLRLYLIRDQMVLDDEWHGMYYVYGKSAWYLITHFPLALATCPPLNLYRWLLLHSFGWNEILLRLPSLLAGISGLLILPLVLKDLVGRRTLIFFTWLLAISPFLIFYSRVCRPYSVVAQTGFLAIVFCYLWMTSGRTRYCVLYVIMGFVAIYFHLFAVVAVYTPLLCGLIFRIIGAPIGPKGGNRNVVPSVAAHVLAGGAIALLLCGLMLPTFLEIAHGSAITHARTDKMTIDTLWQFIQMLFGTSKPVLAGFFATLLILGAVVLLRHSFLLAAVLMSTFALYFLALMVSRPDRLYAALVISRYTIPLFPVACLLVAIGMDKGIEWLQNMFPELSRRMGYLFSLAGVALILALFWWGPLRQTYSTPNNFTNHSVFQESYKDLNRGKSFVTALEPEAVLPPLPSEAVSPFYLKISQQSDVHKIIEYPMHLADTYNLYYFYQWIHGKDVASGYVTSGRKHPRGFLWVDEVLSLAPDKNKLKFRNMIDVEDIGALKKSGAQYILLHTNLIDVMMYLGRKISQENRMVEVIGRLYELYQKAFGPPVYEDVYITAFKIGVDPAND